MYDQVRRDLREIEKRKRLKTKSMLFDMLVDNQISKEAAEQLIQSYYPVISDAFIPQEFDDMVEMLIAINHNKTPMEQVIDICARMARNTHLNRYKHFLRNLSEGREIVYEYRVRCKSCRQIIIEEEGIEVYCSCGNISIANEYGYIRLSFPRGHPEDSIDIL